MIYNLFCIISSFNEKYLEKHKQDTSILPENFKNYYLDLFVSPLMSTYIVLDSVLQGLIQAFLVKAVHYSHLENLKKKKNDAQATTHTNYIKFSGVRTPATGDLFKYSANSIV